MAKEVTPFKVGLVNVRKEIIYLLNILKTSINQTVKNIILFMKIET